MGLTQNRSKYEGGRFHCSSTVSFVCKRSRNRGIFIRLRAQVVSFAELYFEPNTVKVLMRKKNNSVQSN